jgi:hypothetical protein
MSALTSALFVRVFFTVSRAAALHAAAGRAAGHDEHNVELGLV